MPGADGQLGGMQPLPAAEKFDAANNLSDGQAKAQGGNGQIRAFQPQRR